MRGTPLRPGQAPGFTIVETLIALLIAAGGIYGLMQLSEYGMKSQKGVQGAAEQTQIGIGLQLLLTVKTSCDANLVGKTVNATDSALQASGLEIDYPKPNPGTGLPYIQDPSKPYLKTGATIGAWYVVSTGLRVIAPAGTNLYYVKVEAALSKKTDASGAPRSMGAQSATAESSPILVRTTGAATSATIASCSPGDSSIVMPGESQGLKIKNGAASGTIDVDATRIALADDSDIPFLARNVDLTVSLTASGANGLDTGSRAAGTWYYVWVISNGTTTAGLLSASSTAPALPAGYGFKGLVGAVFNNSSNVIPLFQQNGKEFRYLNPFASTQVLFDGQSTTIANVDLTNYVPPSAGTVRIYTMCVDPPVETAANSPNYCRIIADGVNPVGSLAAQTRTTGSYYVYRNTTEQVVPLVNPQRIYYVVTSSAPGSLGRAYIWIQGFTLP